MKSNKVNSDEKLQQSKLKGKNKAIKQTFCQFIINKNILIFHIYTLIHISLF